MVGAMEKSGNRGSAQLGVAFGVCLSARARREGTSLMPTASLGGHGIDRHRAIWAMSTFLGGELTDGLDVGLGQGGLAFERGLLFSRLLRGSSGEGLNWPWTALRHRP